MKLSVAIPLCSEAWSPHLQLVLAAYSGPGPDPRAPGTVHLNLTSSCFTCRRLTAAAVGPLVADSPLAGSSLRSWQKRCRRLQGVFTITALPVTGCAALGITLSL